MQLIDGALSGWVTAAIEKAYCIKVMPHVPVCPWSRPASGVNIFNVSAPPCTMREIVDSIGDALDKHPLPFKMPSSVVLFLSRQLSSIPNIHLIGLNQTIKKGLAEDIYDTHRFEEAYGFQT
jgi:nucleoside-diphosphate-sugar epimerase